MEIKSKVGTVLKYNEGKPDYSIIPWESMPAVVQAFEYGKEKYKKPFTYREGLPVTSLLAASIRHIVSYLMGEDIAVDSGCNHLGHACANLLMILSIKQLHGDKFDDRIMLKTEVDRHEYKRNG